MDGCGCRAVYVASVQAAVCGKVTQTGIVRSGLHLQKCPELRSRHTQSARDAERKTHSKNHPQPCGTGAHLCWHERSNPADGSTLKLRREYEFNGWKNCKKTDPNAKPFLEEKNGAVKLNWKTPPESSSFRGSQPLPKPAGQADLKTPEESVQASIDRLQGKRYSLVLEDLRLHLDAVKMEDINCTPSLLFQLSAAFSTTSNGSNVSTSEWTTFDRLQSQHLTAAMAELWDQVINVLIRRLRDRTHTERKSDIAAPAFVTEMTRIATLTGFDFTAAYLRTVAGSKMPASLKHLDPITLQPKS